MRKKTWVWPLLFGWLLQGCAPLLIGAVGVVGGVAISEDTVQSDVDAEYSQAWHVTLNEIEKMGGEITLEDRSKGLVEATINASKVQVQVDPLTESSVRVTVKARKHYLPHIKLAHQISARILKKL